MRTTDACVAPGLSSSNLCDSIYLNFTATEIKLTFPTGFRYASSSTQLIMR